MAELEWRQFAKFSSGWPAVLLRLWAMPERLRKSKERRDWPQARYSCESRALLSGATLPVLWCRTLHPCAPAPEARAERGAGRKGRPMGAQITGNYFCHRCPATKGKGKNNLCKHIIWGEFVHAARRAIKNKIKRPKTKDVTKNGAVGPPFFGAAFVLRPENYVRSTPYCHALA